MWRLLFSALFIVNFLSFEVLANQCQNGIDLASRALSRDWVESMMAEQEKLSAEQLALRNIAQSHGMRTTSINPEILRAHNPDYTWQVPMGKITNQTGSGRCWIFAGLNMLRPAFMKSQAMGDQLDGRFEFSYNYLFFFSMLEKSNRHLEEVIRLRNRDLSHPRTRSEIIPEIGDGGWFNYFVFLVNKYGLAPKGVMNEASGSRNSSILNEELNAHLAAVVSEMKAYIEDHREEGKRMSSKDIENLREIKMRGMQGVWKVLSAHLGHPPKDFEYRSLGEGKKIGPDGKETKKNKEVVAFSRPSEVKTYTPLEFAEDVVGFDASEWVTVSNNPLRPTNQLYEVEHRNVGIPGRGADRRMIQVLNLDMSRMKEMVVESLDRGQALWFAADVGKDVDTWGSGVMHPALFDRKPFYGFTSADEPIVMDRAQTLFSYAGSANHAMVFVGYDRPEEGGPVRKFKVENSWGKEPGDDGYFHMYAEWFDLYMYEIIVPRSLLSEAELEMLDAQPVKIGLSHWYY